MTALPCSRRAELALAIGIAACLACSDGNGSGGSGDAGSGNGSGGRGGSGATGGGSGGARASGSGGAEADGGNSGLAGMDGSAGAGGESDAGGGAGAVGIIDGSLDSAFGVDGVALSGLEGSESFACLTIQASGAIVVAGSIESRAFLARYTDEGALDTSFGSMGLVEPEISDDTFSVFSKVDQQSDGSLIAVGQSIRATNDMVVARFSAEGQLDTTFGTDGFTIFDSGGNDGGTELMVLPDDTLLIGGNAAPAANGTDFALIHLDADGVPDPDFGSTGFAFAHYDQADGVLAIGRDSQGRIVLGGSVSPGGADRSVAFARFTANGVLDASFGDNGWTVIPKAGATGESVKELVILGGDEILATGSFDGELGLIRLTSTGAVDSSFGVSGLARAGFPGDGTAMLRELSSTLVVGTHDTLAVVARFTDAGDLDPALAGDGFRTYDLGEGDSDRFADVAQQEDGRLIVVGSAEGPPPPQPPPTLDGVLIRLDIR